MTKFRRVELRTTNAEAARAFYSNIFGHDRAMIWPLHEQALARGAKPHWLGQIDVQDVDAAAAQFIARGASPLGPTSPTHDGGRVAVLRDPGGAIVALLTLPALPSDTGGQGVSVVWHALNTIDAERARTNYSELFGWSFTSELDLGRQGKFQQFAWQPGGENVGSIGDIADRPEIHPHWTYFFEVRDLEPALAATRAFGGVTLEPITLPDGTRVCACDDPQGAAFGLLQRP